MIGLPKYSTDARNFLFYTLCCLCFGLLYFVGLDYHTSILYVGSLIIALREYSGFITIMTSKIHL